MIASGRDTISVSSSIKRLAPENVFVVQVKLPSFQVFNFRVFLFVSLFAFLSYINGVIISRVGPNISLFPFKFQFCTLWLLVNLPK